MDLEELFRRAALFHRSGDVTQAERLYLQILEADPANIRTRHMLGVVQAQQGRNLEALEWIGSALKIDSKDAVLLSDYGNVLKALGRFEEALESYDQALALEPAFAAALNNRANALLDMKRFEEAIASYDRALAIKPDYAEALHNRGMALSDLNRFEEALGCYDKALAIKPDFAVALYNRGNALSDLKRFEAALASYDRALAINPDYTDALINRGNVLQDMKRFAEALEGYERARAVDPDRFYALGALANAVLNLCDWGCTEKIAGELEAHITTRKSVIAPLTLLGYSSDPALQLQCAKIRTRDRVPDRASPLWNGTVYRNDKIRIAYLSADFRNHATAYLMAELFERHDRLRFEVTGISFGPDDGGLMRARLERAFDHFIDVREKSDYEVASFLRANQVDIAIDLKGHTQGCRLGILSHRPCPVQVNYLGYPGTMGADFIDYVIADKIVAPLDQQPFFTEKIVHLPDCYQVNDSKRAVAENPLLRKEAGLPEQGFVFCCFNNNWKITAPVFDIWMRLLGAVPDSVLWLMQGHSEANARLRAEAAARGIDPRCLIFAPRVALPEHLARHRLADLFLDTLPYNAHTTASDALWERLPLVTCMGESFAGRVAASLLHAIGLPELVTDSPEAYEALALKLAGDPLLLQSFQHKLQKNRTTHSLFNTDRFRRHIEAAYTTMWEIAQRGEKPRSISVYPVGGHR